MLKHRVGSRIWHILLTITALAATPLSLAAQNQNEPILDQLRSRFQTRELSIGMLFQHVADFQLDRTAPGNNGFSVGNLRLRLQGELDGGFSYFLQTNFIQSPAILDARLSYRFSPNIRVDVGQFKTPFSAEFLTSASAIDFVNRSQVVSALAPARQIGAQALFNGADGQHGLTVGLFNGNGVAANGNDSEDFLFAARGYTTARFRFGESDATAVFGANAAVSNDAAISSGALAGFAGRRTVVGADARLQAGQLLLAGEVVGAVLRPDAGGEQNPWGMYLTGGWHVQPNVQALVRADLFDIDSGSGTSDVLIFGLNYWPTGATEIQVNYLINLQDADVDHHQVLVNFQIGF